MIEKTVFFLYGLDIKLPWDVWIIDAGVIFHELEILEGDEGNVQPEGRPWCVHKGQIMWFIVWSGKFSSKFDHQIKGVGH